MDTLQIVLGIIYVIICIGLVITVLFQDSKSKGLGALAGDNQTESHYSKSKKRTKDVILSRLTVVFAVSFAILSMVLYLLTGRGL